MDSPLESRFREYIQFVESVLAKERGNVSGQGAERRQFHSPKDEILRGIVKSLEGQKEFATLAKATAEKLSESNFDKSIEGLWESVVGNFFRRSRLYLDMWDGKATPASSAWASFLEALKPEHATITYLAPLEGVEFAEDNIDLGSFQIRRFDDPDELNAMLEGRIRRTFFPCAAVDTEELRWRWLLIVTERRRVTGLLDSATGVANAIVSPEVHVEYSSHPAAVGKCLRALLIYPWHHVAVYPSEIELDAGKNRDAWAGPRLPHIPFSFTRSDLLVAPPVAAPDLSLLEREPCYDGGDEPARWLYLNGKETQDFAAVTREMDGIIREVADGCLPEWAFIDVGLNFFVKGCLTNGLEGLLWYITAVEAFIGEKTESSLTKLLTNRVKMILGVTEPEQRKMAKKFTELYDLRSDLVHGNLKLQSRRTDLGHVGEAYEISRQIAGFMLKYLRVVQSRLSGRSSPIPSRENLLRVIEMDGASRQDVYRIIECLPREFPELGH